MGKLVAEFEIDYLPKLPNTSLGRHWSAKHKERVKWGRYISEQCTLHKIAGLGLEQAAISFTRFSSKEPDFDNLVSSFKPVTDALVKCGVIIDDKPSVIGQSKFAWEYRATKYGGKISIKIES